MQSAQRQVTIRRQQSFQLGRFRNKSAQSDAGRSTAESPVLALPLSLTLYSRPTASLILSYSRTSSVCWFTVIRSSAFQIGRAGTRPAPTNPTLSGVDSMCWLELLSIPSQTVHSPPVCQLSPGWNWGSRIPPQDARSHLFA